MDKVEVTQADREAAAPFQGSWPEKNANTDALPQSFARHAHAARIECARAVIEAAAKCCDDAGAYEQEGYGLTRATQNYFRARNYIRALDPEQIVKGMSQ